MRRSRARELAAIVLAAGAARRFGVPKQLARLADKPLIQHAIERAIDVAGASTFVVLGHAALRVRKVLPEDGYTTVVNRDWRRGLASSIRTAVERLPDDCDAALLLLADQPFITRRSLRRLVSKWRRQPGFIIASQYGAATGVPCIFPRWCFAELRRLRGDQGARRLLLRYPRRVVAVAHPEAAIDIDTADDLAATARAAAVARRRPSRES